MARQARELGITAPLLGGDGWVSPELIKLAGTGLEGCFFSAHYSAEDQSPVIQDFLKSYKAKYNGEEPDDMAALGYDSVKVLVDAMKRAGTVEADKLKEAINATKDFPGVTGKITLDANRNASKPAVVMEIKGTGYKYKETVAP
jgi:branched-chain amino acid transport system substrate-binding protein